MTRHQKSSPAESTNIDPVEFPILARHWPFVPPNWRPIGQVTAGIIDCLASQRAVDDDDHEAAA